MPRFHLGTWLTWTIATPIGSLVVSDHGNAIWSAQISLFLQTVLSLPLLHIFLWKIFLSFYLRFLNRQSFKPVQTIKLTEHGQILIRRLSARFDFLLPSYYGVNRRSLTRLDFQLQVVNTGSSYNPETISPVWFDYESPVLYMVKPVFITTRYGLSSTDALKSW